MRYTNPHTHTPAQHKPTRARRAVLLVSTRLNAGPQNTFGGQAPLLRIAHQHKSIQPPALLNALVPRLPALTPTSEQLRTAARVPGFALLTGGEAFRPPLFSTLDRVARTAARTRPRGRSVRAGRAQNAPAPHPDSQLNRTLGTATAPHFLLNAQAAAAAPAAAHEGAQAAGAVRCMLCGCGAAIATS